MVGEERDRQRKKTGREQAAKERECRSTQHLMRNKVETANRQGPQRRGSRDHDRRSIRRFEDQGEPTGSACAEVSTRMKDPSQKSHRDRAKNNSADPIEELPFHLWIEPPVIGEPACEGSPK